MIASSFFASISAFPFLLVPIYSELENINLFHMQPVKTMANLYTPFLPGRPAGVDTPLPVGPMRCQGMEKKGKREGKERTLQSIRTALLGRTVPTPHSLPSLPHSGLSSPHPPSVGTPVLPHCTAHRRTAWLCSIYPPTPVSCFTLAHMAAGGRNSRAIISPKTSNSRTLKVLINSTNNIYPSKCERK